MSLSIYRGDNSDGTAIDSNDNETILLLQVLTICYKDLVGDVFVVDANMVLGTVNAELAFKEVNDSSTRFLAGHEYEIVSLGDSDGVVNQRVKL